MILRVYLIFCITIALISARRESLTAADVEIQGTQTFIDCKPQDGDKLIYNQHFQENATFLAVQKLTIIYPEKGDDREYIIDCIKVYDNLALTGPHEGTTEIVSGGVGHASVIIRVQSARSQGYDIDVEMWGRKIN